MRAAVLVSVLTGLGLAACVDLFHGTDFETACDVDAAACAAIDANLPPPESSPEEQDAGSDAPTDFCAWHEDGGEIVTASLHACAWLGACAGAAGDNALSSCLLHATTAYDCAANPNRPVLGATHALWDCLWQVRSCDDVLRCVEPTATRDACTTSDGGYLACDPTKGVLVTCEAGALDQSPPASVEACAASGQTCQASGNTCDGPSGCDPQSPSIPSCVADSTFLQDCEPDGGSDDQGVNCADFGAGACVEGSGGAGGACLAVAEGGATCTPTDAVTCVGGRFASGCPSGVPETYDCAALLGAITDPLTCDASAPGRPWDVSRACSAGSCFSQPDTCQGTVITSCDRGAIARVDCAAQGFTGCAVTTYADDPTPRARCTGGPASN